MSWINGKPEIIVVDAVEYFDDPVSGIVAVHGERTRGLTRTALGVIARNWVPVPEKDVYENIVLALNDLGCQYVNPYPAVDNAAAAVVTVNKDTLRAIPGSKVFSDVWMECQAPWSEYVIRDIYNTGFGVFERNYNILMCQSDTLGKALKIQTALNKK